MIDGFIRFLQQRIDEQNPMIFHQIHNIPIITLDSSLLNDIMDNYQISLQLDASVNIKQSESSEQTHNVNQQQSHAPVLIDLLDNDPNRIISNDKQNIQNQREQQSANTGAHQTHQASNVSPNLEDQQDFALSNYAMIILFLVIVLLVFGVSKLKTWFSDNENFQTKRHRQSFHPLQFEEDANAQFPNQLQH